MLDHSLRRPVTSALRVGSEQRVGVVGAAAVVAFCALALLVRELDAPVALGAMLAVAAAVPLLLRPELAAPIVVFVIYTNIPVLATYRGVPAVVASAFTLLLAVPLAHHVIARREPLRTDTVFALMLAFLAVMLISALGAKSMSVAFDYVQTFVLEGLVLYWLVINTVRNRASLARVIWTLVAAAALLGALTVYQEASGAYDQQFYGLAQRNVDYMQLQQMDMEDPETIELLRNFEGGRARRAEGPMNEPNRFAQILLMVLPLALYAYRTARRRSTRLGAAAAGALILSGMVFSDSRGALVGLVALALLAAYMQWIRRSHLLIAGILIALSLPIIAPRYVARALSLASVTSLAEGTNAKAADGAIRGRATEMLAAAQAFLDHPIIGVGPGQYLHFYSLEYHQKNPRFKFRDIQKGRRAHSLYAELPAELGVVGLVSFFAIFAVLLHRLNRARRRWRTERPELADLAAAFAFSLLAFLITSAFLHLSFQRYLWLFVALASAALHVVRMAEQGGREAAA